MQDIAKSYSCALSSSIGVALAIRKIVSMKFGTVTGAKGILLNSVSAFFAVSTAGFLNAYLMRQTELVSGINIFDPNNSEI
jgi:hypothetical protein